MGKVSQKAIAEIKDNAVYILQAGTPVYIKTADVCAITGKSNQWIGQLTSQGTLAKSNTPYGSLYELTPNLQRYIGQIADRVDDIDEDDKKVEQQRRKAEATFKAAKASMASMDAKERAGKMHRSEDVAAMTEDLVYAVRGALLALPGRCSVDVVAAKDAAEAAEIIRREVYAIMNELSNYRYDAAKYEERVRARLNMDALEDDNEED
nr:MAG TPA: Protein of unknown function (DUF1441) [Caudoviricetes sp.]